MHAFLLHIELKGHSTLFEDINRRDTNLQIHFIVVPFIIIEMKRLNCVHGVDRSISSKKKTMGNKSEW